jgi:hypothetical protein
MASINQALRILFGCTHLVIIAVCYGLSGRTELIDWAHLNLSKFIFVKLAVFGVD